jgi:hypothetical protein
VINLDDPYYEKIEGVYVIRDGSEPPVVLVVGYGKIREGLLYWSNDPRLYAYSSRRLWATWAEIPAERQAGAARYVTEQLRPLVQGETPDVPSLPVELP